MSPRTHSYKVLTPIEAKIVGALGQTMYPREGNIPIDATQARAIEYVDEWLTKVPTKERILLRLMFVLFEVSMPAFGPRRTRRFSRADPQSQYEYLCSWETSRIYFRRASMYGLRSVFALAYLADAEVQRHIGVEFGDETLRRQREERASSEQAREMHRVADRPGRDVDASADVTVFAEAVEALRRRVSGGEN